MTVLDLVFLQSGVGGLVAGLRAGLVKDTWPLMVGVFIPPADVLWRLEPFWTNLVDNPVTVQFFHRIGVLRHGRRQSGHPNADL